MPSGFGFSGASQASVQSLRRMRLPLRELPPDLQHLAHAIADAARADHAVVDRHPRDRAHDEGHGRLALLRRVLAGLGDDMARALRIKPGMHVDGNWPAFGCAVAASRALGLTDKQAASAVSFAACQVPMSLYLPVRQGSTARNAYLGHAAVLGIQGALAAQAGIDAPTLESVSEYARVGLGKEVGPWVGPGRFEILEAYLKPFAAVRHVHYGAAAALALRERIGTARIEQIRLSVYEEATVYCANRAPATAIQAQFSLTFGLAAALRFGSIDHETYRPAQFNDPELRRLESLVEVAVDPDLTARQTRGATLRVLVNGQWLEATVATILGDAALPLTDAQVIEKFISYAQGTVGVDAAHRIANDLLYGDLDVPYTGLLV